MTCVEENSTVNVPKILLGQVHCVQENGEVSLLWYKATSASMYKFELDGRQWCERVESLVPVSVQAFTGFRHREADSQSRHGGLGTLTIFTGGGILYFHPKIT